ncbi:MAG: hypothetical protein NTY01_17305 [Verrucomicrobia bacterium]|nr:hypothetical protein [Verrucomicrobiota bacterium]
MTLVLLAAAAAGMTAAATTLPPSLPVLPYSFRQTTTVETLDTAHKTSQRETKVEDVFPVEGKLLFHRLISRNGKPLSPKEAEAETKRLEAFRQAIRDGKKPRQSEQVTDLTARFSGDELDRAFISEEAGREELRGRRCIVYKFRGRPGRSIKIGGQYQKFFDVAVDGVVGRLWIDEEERKPARGEVRLKQPVRIGFGLLIHIKQFDLDVDFERLEPGVWWPQKAEGTADARFLIFQPCVRSGSVLNENFKRLPLPEPPPGKPAAATAQ